MGHPQTIEHILDGQGGESHAGKDNPGTGQHPEEAPVCLNSQGLGGTGKDNHGPEQHTIHMCVPANFSTSFVCTSDPG